MNTLVLIGKNLSANVAGLADYGITEANISSLAQLAEAYGALLTAPRSAITFKSAATASVGEKFAKLSSILLRLDGLAAAQKILNTAFFNAYKAAGIVVDNKGRAKPKPAVSPAASLPG